MINKKTFLTLFLAIAAFSAIYLYIVRQERLNAVINYFPNPQVGDIYKVQTESSRNGIAVFYLKIKDIGEESIYFYKSRLPMNIINDTFLKQFDTSDVIVYTKKELNEIKNGKWDTPAKDNTLLLEIERK